jgi:hypothetical protein
MNTVLFNGKPTFVHRVPRAGRIQHERTDTRPLAEQFKAALKAEAHRILSTREKPLEKATCRCGATFCPSDKRTMCSKCEDAEAAALPPERREETFFCPYCERTVKRRRRIQRTCYKPECLVANNRERQIIERKTNHMKLERIEPADYGQPNWEHTGRGIRCRADWKGAEVYTFRGEHAGGIAVLAYSKGDAQQVAAEVEHEAAQRYVPPTA